MDRVYRLVELFCALPHDVGEINYILSFIEAMNGMLSMILEALMDARDVHDTNEYYAEVYSSIHDLQNLLRAYGRFIMVQQETNEE